MKNFKLKIIVIVFILFCSNKLIAQNLYSGIEIGAKGLKTYIVDVRDVEKEIVVIENFWSQNITAFSGVVADGSITELDMDLITKKVVSEYQKVLETYKIDKNRIYIVISSGLSIAKNTDSLIQKINNAINITAVVITTERESKFLFKSAVPLKVQEEAVLIDIGSGNTKGGFVEKKDNTLKFNNFNINLGTMSLTELLTKQYKLGSNSSFNDFVAATDSYYPTLSNEFKKVFEEKNRSLDKKKIYISGGAIWAFYSLAYEDDTKKNLLEFNPSDIKAFDDDLRNNFEKFIFLGTKNKEVARVLKTFTRENLIVSNSLLKAAIENIKNINSKKIFFGKQPEVSWVVTYICEQLTKEPKGSF